VEKITKPSRPNNEHENYEDLMLEVRRKREEEDRLRAERVKSKWKKTIKEV
jgi:hypothetical protein